MPVTAVVFVETEFHLTPVATAGQFGGGPTDRGRDEGEYPAGFAGIAMVRFRIIAGVRQGGRDLHALLGVLQQWLEAVCIGARTAIDQDADHEMRFALKGGFQLGVAFRSSVIPFLVEIINEGSPFVDVPLWERFTGSKKIVHNDKMNLSMKGLPGINGIGFGHTATLMTTDKSLDLLRDLIQ